MTNFKEIKMNFLKIIKLPYIDELYSPVVFDFYFKHFVR